MLGFYAFHDVVPMPWSAAATAQDLVKQPHLTSLVRVVDGGGNTLVTSKHLGRSTDTQIVIVWIDRKHQWMLTRLQRGAPGKATIHRMKHKAMVGVTERYLYALIRGR